MGGSPLSHIKDAIRKMQEKDKEIEDVQGHYQQYKVVYFIQQNRMKSRKNKNSLMKNKHS